MGNGAITGTQAADWLKEHRNACHDPKLVRVADTNGSGGVDSRELKAAVNDGRVTLDGPAGFTVVAATKGKAVPKVPLAAKASEAKPVAEATAVKGTVTREAAAALLQKYPHVAKHGWLVALADQNWDDKVSATELAKALNDGTVDRSALPGYEQEARRDTETKEWVKNQAIVTMGSAIFQ